MPIAQTTGHWIDAAPFRAHAHNLMAVGALTVDDLAALTGLSAPLLDHLLRGRDGRPLRRLSPETGRRLLQVTQAGVRALRWHRISTSLAIEPYRRLRAAGWSEEAIAARVGATVPQLAELQVCDAHCSLLLGVRLTAAAHRAVRDGERSRTAA